ncbi:MAG: hypothetical protein AAF329_23390 [Cyanobacteria bacterium P01_A01_bin.17]
MIEQSVIIQLFDAWLAQANAAEIQENCRTEGSVFFRFMASRGVAPRICYRIIKDATGYSPQTIWRDASPLAIRKALVSYFYSRQGILAEEHELGESVSPLTALQIAEYFWRDER